VTQKRYSRGQEDHMCSLPHYGTLHTSMYCEMCESCNHGIGQFQDCWRMLFEVIITTLQLHTAVMKLKLNRITTRVQLQA
jgi:hypothetical protein